MITELKILQYIFWLIEEEMSSPKEKVGYSTFKTY